jgi:hypothetical protein
VTQRLTAISSAEFATPAARSAFSLAVRESVTVSSSEIIYPIAIAAARDAVDAVTSVSHVEVTFEQSSTVHSLGVSETAAAVSLLSTRLQDSCSAGMFDAILHKMGEKLQNSVLRGVQVHDVLLTDSRFTEIARTGEPSGQPSSAPEEGEEGGGAGGGVASYLPIAIVGGALLIAICVLRQVCLCCTKPNEVSPRQRRMAVSNIQVLPS